MSKHLFLLAGVSSLTLFSAGLARAAEAAASDSGSTVGEIVVTADKAGLLEKRPSSTVFGIDKPLIDTPRSASFVSNLTLERYGILTIDKLMAVSPGTYTASYYGVPGSLNIRGTLAENYFRGFKRIEDRGTYATPIGDAAQIEIVRGPPSPLYGPGKVGGMLNFIPKSANADGAYITEPTGEITGTFGSYSKKNVTGQVGLPIKMGGIQGGVYAYGEVEDSDSFYRGIHPRRQTAEVSFDFDLGNGWSTAFGGMYYHSDGDVQTPGWNRITQDLINNGTYITGHNTTLVDSNHDGRLEPTEVSPGGFYPFTTSLYTPFFGFPPAVDPRFVLDTGVGTTHLDPRTVFISSADFSKTHTETLYYDLVKDLGEHRTLKMQLFDDELNNSRFVSYGFPAHYNAHTIESRVTYNFEFNPSDFITSKNFIGASYTYYTGHQMETYNSGLISLDRRDLSVGATPTDIFDSPFTTGDNGLGWETDIHSHYHDTGVFFTSDIVVGEKLDLVLGGRYDGYGVTARDNGIFVFCAAADHCELDHSAGKGKFSYSASATYHLPWGFMPYITYARDNALEVAQAGNLTPQQVINGSWLSSSELEEAGLKFQLLNKTLIGSLALYHQTRTQLSGLNNVSQPTIGKGFEYEFRWVANKNFSFTLTGNLQHTEVIGPDHSVAYIPASTALTSGINGYGGAFLTFDFSTLPGRAGNYNYSLIPHATGSIFGTYTSDDYAWGRIGGTLGVSWATKTSGLVQNAVTYPAYAIVNGSLVYNKGPYEASLNIDNLLDKLYFTPDQDVYANIGALPGRGREWRIMLKRKF